MIEIRIPYCPMCNEPPVMMVTPGSQVFCGNDECPVFCWDMTDDPARWEPDEHGNRPGVTVQTIDLDLSVPQPPPSAPMFTCPRCGARSTHPGDLEEGYCGACHDWTGPRLATASHHFNDGTYVADPAGPPLWFAETMATFPPGRFTFRYDVPEGKTFDSGPWVDLLGEAIPFEVEGELTGSFRLVEFEAAEDGRSVLFTMDKAGGFNPDAFDQEAAR